MGIPHSCAKTLFPCFLYFFTLSVILHIPGICQIVKKHGSVLINISHSLCLRRKGFKSLKSFLFHCYGKISSLGSQLLFQLVSEIVVQNTKGQTCTSCQYQQGHHKNGFKNSFCHDVPPILYPIPRTVSI